MAHFYGKQLMSFFRLFAAGYINKNSEHDTTFDIRVITLAAC